MDNNAMTSILMMGVFMVAMYFFLIRPQKKKEDAIKKVRDSIEIGDEIVTIGGIIGRVTLIKDDTLLIETGTDRNKMRVKRWSVQTVEKVKMD